VLAVAGQHSTSVELAALVAADPEIVVVAPCGYDLARADAEARALVDDPRWRWLAGRAVWAVDANAFVSRPGPRLVDGVELLARVLHPACFGAARRGARRARGLAATTGLRRHPEPHRDEHEEHGEGALRLHRREQLVEPRAEVRARP
jgi:hypothetical protein